MSDKMTTTEAVAACLRLGIKITGVPKRRGTLPAKKMGMLADELHALRERRLAVNKLVDAMKREETRLIDHIIDNVDIDKESGVMGAAYKATVQRETVYVAEDWDKFYAYVGRTKSFHFLNKALNKGSLSERFDSGKPVPGIGTMDVKKISLTKV
jgi:hypothetical protein